MHAAPTFTTLLIVAALSACTDRSTADAAQGTEPERGQASAAPDGAAAAGATQDAAALSDGTRGRTARIAEGGGAGSAQGSGDSSAVLQSSAGPQMYLVDASGASVYMLEGNTDGSKCTATCEEAWPPVLATASRGQAGSGLDAQLLAMNPRPDQSYQVSYGTSPLYRYAGDAGAGRTNGHKVRDKWGEWSLVGLDGKPVTSPLTEAGAAEAAAGGTAVPGNGAGTAGQ